MQIKKTGTFQSMRFKTWVYYVFFSVCILSLLLLIQVVLFEPVYKNSKMKEATNVVNQLAQHTDDDEYLQQTVINNDGCAVIVTSSKMRKGIDSLGVSCLIYHDGKVNSDYLNALKDSETGELSLMATVNDTTEMLIYGKKFTNEKGKSYYVLFNTPIQPAKSTVAMLRTELIYISGIVLLLSLFMSLYFSHRLSKPVIEMTHEARKLSTGNTDVQFKHGEFKEMNDLADTLNFASHELGQINELRKDLIANVSHDIKTPLTMITAYAEMIRDISGDNEKKRNEHLEVILQESEYLNRLVSDMRDLSILQSGQVQLYEENFDLGSVIREAAYKFKTITKSENINIELHVEPELVAYGDKFKILEVLYNFIGNAIKHYGDDRTIVVNAFRQPKGWIRVEVIDHGTGIPHEALNHIWERYYKTDKSYQRAHSGTGLGLAISKAILDAHHCEYGVDSVLQKGSTFYFLIAEAKLD
ncbi:MAG: HAMP domain-containing histidine kinase [Erysipelotrichaceae bacterium]|nr:HAMP domain-containing histidine kinase [Erysipelotrichaceae bacterium]